MAEHKNKTRAPIEPLDGPTLALSMWGLGFMRPAPGTWGSMPPVGMAVVLMWAGAPYWFLQAVLLVVLVIASASCVLFGGYAEVRFGRKDAPEVVADETAGQCLSLMFWPLMLHEAGSVMDQRGLGGGVLAAMAAGMAFVAFRVFDIIKPHPARKWESWPKGWGVLVDDLVAGVYAAVAVQAVVWIGVLIAWWSRDAPAPGG